MLIFSKKKLMVSTVILLLAAQGNFLPAQEDVKKESITGTLIRIDEETGSVYFISESRMVRLKGDADICVLLKSLINSSLLIYFLRTDTGDLIILSFRIVEDKNSQD